MRYNKTNEPIPSRQEVLTDGCPYITSEHFLSNAIQIKDTDKIKTLLKNVSHFRLSPYISKSKKILGFKNLDCAERLYRFDERLRDIIFNAIGKIEVALRVQLLEATQDPLFYKKIFLQILTLKQSSNEREQSRAKALEKLQEDIQKQVKRTEARLYGRYGDNIPAWELVEVISFGTLSKLFSFCSIDVKNKVTYTFLSNLSKNYAKAHSQNSEEKKRLEQVPRVLFEQWLRALVYLRNLTHHYSRVWDRRLDIGFVRPRVDSYIFDNNLEEKGVIFALTAIYCILENLDRDASKTFKIEIRELIKKEYKFMGLKDASVRTSLFWNWED